MIEKKFIVPAYYKDFSCKGGDCRTCCCGGWAVTVSMKEYFSLLGLECSQELRYKIDGALHLLKDADENRFAQILPAFDGTCPMRRKSDGYCALQCECGEDVLPAVCRYYPRSPRLWPRAECCISCSCEKVLEDLIATPEKLTFEERKLAFYFDEKDAPIVEKDVAEERKKCMDLLQDRAFSVTERMDHIFRFLFEKGGKTFSLREADAALTDILSFYSDSPSIGEECERALSNKTTLEEAAAALRKKFSQADLWAEKILSNHFFFMKFPYVEKNENLSDVALGLAGLFALWTVLIADERVKTTDDFVDITGKLFRVAEHTRFYKNVAILIEEAFKKD